MSVPTRDQSGARGRIASPRLQVRDGGGKRRCPRTADWRARRREPVKRRAIRQRHLRHKEEMTVHEVEGRKECHIDLNLLHQSMPHCPRGLTGNGWIPPGWTAIESRKARLQHRKSKRRALACTATFEAKSTSEGELTRVSTLGSPIGDLNPRKNTVHFRDDVRDRERATVRDRERSPPQRRRIDKSLRAQEKIVSRFDLSGPPGTPGRVAMPMSILGGQIVVNRAAPECGDTRKQKMVTVTR